MEEGKSLESVAGQVLGGQSGMQDGSFPMPRARRKDLVLGRTTLPWSRRQLSEAGKGEMNESRAVNARTFVAQSAKSGAFKTGRANEGARAQSEKARNHISRKKEQLQGAMRQGAGGGPALAQAHARRGGRRTWDDGEGDGGDHDDHDDHEDGEDDGGGGQRQVPNLRQKGRGNPRLSWLLPLTTAAPAAAAQRSALARCGSWRNSYRQPGGTWPDVVAAAKPVAAVAIEAILSDDQPTLPGPVRRRYAKLRSASTSMIAAAKTMSDRRLLSPTARAV
ncbi:hypothetical protein BM1_06353 [Bipolaris maydis]|nr:hypothetical protein BM1_06353 [Bipolaris maydis]